MKVSEVGAITLNKHTSAFTQKKRIYTVKSFIFVGLKFRGFEFNNEFVDI